MGASGAYRCAALGAVVLCVIASVVLLLSPGTTAHAARLSAPSLATESRPAEGVAYARIAVVRILTYYDGTVSGGTVPIPVLNPCAADGALVGTTGKDLNSLNYVLLPTSAISPLTPCQGVQAAFKQLYGNASGWNINRIDVLLNAAYTGTANARMGAIRFSIDPSQILTNGGQSAAPLVALPLNVPGGTHDLPELSVPQPSDPPATGKATILDLTGDSAQPLGSDVIAQQQISASLYPVAFDASALTTLPAPTATAHATATTPQQTVTGGTVVAATAPLATAAAVDTAVGQQVSSGAPEIDSNGRLVGMVVRDATGHHILTPLGMVSRAIGVVNGKPGQLMSLWQQGLNAFYAPTPQFAQATAAFSSLASSYPDFGGVVPFQQAAENKSTMVPSLAAVPVPPTATPASAALDAAQAWELSRRALVIGGGLLSFALLLFAVVLLVRMRRLAHRASSSSAPRRDDLPLLGAASDGPMYVEELPTQPVPAITTQVLDSHVLDDQSTLRVPAIKPALTRTRKGMAVMPHATGLTDTGIKRANDPNQDNIYVARGIRVVGGQVQPYGLFIVADGMGGHLNGREASRIAIEQLTTTILRALTTGLPLDDATLRRLLKEGVKHADETLRTRNLNERLDMGTTITGALLVNDMAYIVNVGDSRTYLMNPETGLHQITVDHSVVASLVAAGVIKPEDIYTHPRRNQIYRSLGGEQDETEPDIFEVPLQAGDKLLLCSDGLWEMVRDPQIESILRGVADPALAAQLLVREANTNGGEDNIGVVIVRLLEDVPAGAPAELTVIVEPEMAHDSATE